MAADDFFKPSPILDRDDICARVCADGAYIDIIEHGDGDAVMIANPDAARALRDWLNEVLP